MVKLAFRAYRISRRNKSGGTFTRLLNDTLKILCGLKVTLFLIHNRHSLYSNKKWNPLADLLTFYNLNDTTVMAIPGVLPYPFK